MLAVALASPMMLRDNAKLKGDSMLWTCSRHCRRKSKSQRPAPARARARAHETSSEKEDETSLEKEEERDVHHHRHKDKTSSEKEEERDVHHHSHGSHGKDHHGYQKVRDAVHNEEAVPKKHKKLFVIIPSFEGHLQQWERQMDLIRLSLSRASDCSFTAVDYWTIVSTATEKAMFESSLTRLNIPSTYLSSFHIATLQEALLATAGIQHEVPFANKNWHQSLKKTYGCLFASGLRVEDHHHAPNGDMCFALDSESLLLRNTYCEVASAYVLNRTVFVNYEMSPPHKAVVATSRLLLAGAAAQDDVFGNFYAMEIYHWFWDTTLVQDFLQTVSLVNLIRESDFARKSPYIEETIWHYAYGHRDVWSYNFVDLKKALVAVVGADKYQAMKLASPPGEVMETPMAHLHPISIEDANRIGSMLSWYGIRLLRCDYRAGDDAGQADALQAHIDLCVSS